MDELKKMDLESTLKTRKARTVQACEKAFVTMEHAIRGGRDALADADYFFGETEGGQGSGALYNEPTQVPQQTLHTLAWGFANASTHIENAIRDAAEYKAAKAQLAEARGEQSADI